MHCFSGDGQLSPKRSIILKHVVERPLLVTSKNKRVPLYFLWNTKEL